MSPHRAAALIPKIICAVVALTAAAWLIVLIASRQPLHVHWSIQIILASGAILTSLLVEHHRFKNWARPLEQLQELLPQVHQNQAAIDELSRVNGSLSPIVPIIQNVLRDLKQQKTAVAELHEEIRQRVAQRTDALERQMGSLRQQASRDALTGLYNRRMLDQHLPGLLDRCRAENIDLALLMSDIDFFKSMNDTLGHAAGDELLKAIAQITRSSLRDGDLAFRCGGDEFVILLVDCDAQTAQETAKRLISLTDAYAATLRGVDPRPRLSLGVCQLSQLANATAEMMLQSADKALYDMKFTRKRDLAGAESALHRRTA